MRKCRSCNKILPKSMFYKLASGKDGLQTECANCAKTRAREYRQKMRNLVGRWKKIKGCQVCGFKAVHSSQLDLDHIDPSKKTYKGSHRAFDPGWSKERVKKELAKCVVTCKNCHALRTYEEKHWKNPITTVRMRQSSAQDLTTTQESV